MRAILVVAAASLVAATTATPAPSWAQTCNSTVTPSGRIVTNCSDGSQADTIFKPGGATTYITPPPAPSLPPAPYPTPYMAPPPANDFAPGGAFQNWAPYLPSIR